MALWENVVTAGVTVVALVLSLVAFRSWWFTRSGKVLLLALGFSLFFVKGVIVSAGLFLSRDWGERFLLPSLLIDLCALGLFYGAVLRRSAP